MTSILHGVRPCAVLLAVALGLGGCQFTRSTTPAQVDPVAAVPQRMPSRAEEAIGARENPRVIAEYGGIYSDPELESALAAIVARLVAASDDPSRHYRVTILNSPVANAFALPGGYLYITRGLLALTDDASELAAVLAHEIAHVLANHALARAKVVEQTDIVERVAADVLSDQDAGRSAVTRSQSSLAQFSRAQEAEADRIGIEIAWRAGYDPFAASRFLDKLERYAAFRSATGERDQAASFLSSHPAALERRTAAIQAARRFAAPGVGEQGRDAYLASLGGIVFGDDPSEGYVRGREFLHPRRAIAFRVPEGYRLENTREAVLAAAGPDTAMRFDGAADAAGMMPADYLESGWINGLIEDSVQEIEVNGLAAATAEAQAGEWSFRIGAVRLGGGMYRFIFADRNDGGAIAEALEETLDSFRRLSPAEVARLRPLRVETVAARSGDTVDSLAARLRGVERQRELFLLLNGLSETDPIEPGRTYKIIVD